MLADGILQCVLVCLLILGAVLMVCGPECRGAGQGVLVSAICCVGLPVQSVQIAMWVYMFQSDKACGPSLHCFFKLIFSVYILNVLSDVHDCNVPLFYISWQLWKTCTHNELQLNLPLFNNVKYNSQINNLWCNLDNRLDLSCDAQRKRIDTDS